MFRKFTFAVSIIICSFASASVDIPLAWETVTLTIEQRGGASVTASRTSEGFLKDIAVSIRGRQIDIPRSCLPNDVPVFFNHIKLDYGHLTGDIPYWVLKFGVDYKAAFDGLGLYHLLLLEDRVKLGYIEYAESEGVLVDGEALCGSWQAAPQIPDMSVLGFVG